MGLVVEGIPTQDSSSASTTEAASIKSEVEQGRVLFGSTCHPSLAAPILDAQNLQKEPKKGQGPGWPKATRIPQMSYGPDYQLTKRTWMPFTSILNMALLSITLTVAQTSASADCPATALHPRSFAKIEKSTTTTC